LFRQDIQRLFAVFHNPALITGFFGVIFYELGYMLIVFDNKKLFFGHLYLASHAILFLNPSQESFGFQPGEECVIVIPAREGAPVFRPEGLHFTIGH
jgi:hypothetical protein